MTRPASTDAEGAVAAIFEAARDDPRAEPVVDRLAALYAAGRWQARRIEAELLRPAAEPESEDDS